MGSHFNPQGNYDPTQKVPTSTQYGNNNQYAPPPPYYNPYPNPSPQRRNRWLFGLLGVIGLLLVAIIVLLVRLLPSGTPSTQTTPTPIVNSTQQPTVASSPTVQPTTGTTPVNNNPTNGGGQEFPQQHTVQGPAIVEYWSGQVNSQNQAINCGTFKLPAGQSFTWTHLGHFWTYASNEAVDANWDGHVASYKAKPENALCSVGSPPS